MGTTAVFPSYAGKKKTEPKMNIVFSTLSPNDQKRYDYFFLEAARQQAAGNYAEAFDLFEHARKINPKAAEVYYNQASYYAQLKNDSIALEYFKKAAALNPDNYTYLERVAHYYIESQKYDKAIEEYETLTRKNPENSDALEILAQLYRMQKDYPKMISTINRIETVEGSSEQLTLSKVRVYEMMEDKKSAYRELKSLTDKHPNDVNYRLMLGNWLLGKDRKKEAYKLFLSALKDEPENANVQSSLYDYYSSVGQDSLAKSLMVKILLNKKTDNSTKATLLHQAIQKNEADGGDSTKIIKLFDQVLAIPQTNSDIAELKVAYMLMKKLPQDSINRALNQVLEISPENTQARLQLLQSFWEAKKYDEIIENCNSALQYSPDEMMYFYFLGMAYFQKKDDDQALNSFRTGISRINSQSDANMVSDFYGMVGDILHTKGYADQAFAAYDSCLQWKDDNISVLNNYAYYLSVEKKNLPKAEQMSYKTVKAEPENATFLDTYAWILFQEERYSEAKIYIDQAKDNLDTISPSPTIYDHLGDIYYKNNLKEDAVKFWKQASEADSTLEATKWKLTNKQYISDEEYNKKWKKEKSSK